MIYEMSMHGRHNHSVDWDHVRVVQVGRIGLLQITIIARWHMDIRNAKAVVLVCFLTARAMSAEQLVDIRDFVAVSNGKTLCTAMIQQAIDRSAAAGGGTACFSPGTWIPEVPAAYPDVGLFGTLPSCELFCRHVVKLKLALNLSFNTEWLYTHCEGRRQCGMVCNSLS
jgi:hypothetical protein